MHYGRTSTQSHLTKKVILSSEHRQEYFSFKHGCIIIRLRKEKFCTTLTTLTIRCLSKPCNCID